MKADAARPALAGRMNSRQQRPEVRLRGLLPRIRALRMQRCDPDFVPEPNSLARFARLPVVVAAASAAGDGVFPG